MRPTTRPTRGKAQLASASGPALSASPGPSGKRVKNPAASRNSSHQRASSSVRGGSVRMGRNASASIQAAPRCRLAHRHGSTRVPAHHRGMIAMTDPTPRATLDEMRAQLASLPGPDLAAAAAAAAREAQLTKPAGALGRLEQLSEWLATWQAKHPPRIDHPRTAVFAGNHGVAARGVSAYPAEVTAQMVQNFIRGGAAVNQLCRAIDADLRVYEMALEQPTAVFTTAPAMSDEDCAMAMAYGMMAVEPGVDL